MMVKIILHGCNGKMGQVICGLAKDDKDCEIVAGLDSNKAGGSGNFPVYTDRGQCDIPADVVVDFSTAAAVDAMLDYCLEKKLPAVICTTGLSEATQEKIHRAAEYIPLFRSANMSIGINLLAKLIEKAAPYLYEAGYDIEILEKHHNRKIDAPSGTALLLADAVNDSLMRTGNSNCPLPYVYDRHSQGKRNREEIGIQALRGGSIVGEHTLVFAGRDEVIELTHTAYSRDVFAAGAIRAAKYLKGKPPGLYNMQDMLGE